MRSANHNPRLLFAFVVISTLLLLETNGTKESVMPFSPWPMPPVPDVDLASFALRHAVRLADRPALIDRPRRHLRGARRAGGARGARVRGRRRHPSSCPTAPTSSSSCSAGLRAGAAVTPVSPLYTEREVANHLRIAPTLSEPGDVALLLSSSGTTGLPKVVQLSHRAVVTNICQTAEVYPLRARASACSGWRRSSTAWA